MLSLLIDLLWLSEVWNLTRASSLHFHNKTFPRGVLHIQHRGMNWKAQSGCDQYSGDTSKRDTSCQRKDITPGTGSGERILNLKVFADIFEEENGLLLLGVLKYHSVIYDLVLWKTMLINRRELGGCIHQWCNFRFRRVAFNHKPSKPHLNLFSLPEGREQSHFWRERWSQSQRCGKVEETCNEDKQFIIEITFVQCTCGNVLFYI